MRIFSRLVFICNLCFLASIVMRSIEVAKRSKGDLDPAINIQALQGTLVVLGYGAIFLNIAFVVWAVWALATARSRNLPHWLVWFNMLVLPVQIWYFFFSNF